MSTSIKRICEVVRELRAQGKPWLEVQDEVEKASIRQGDFEPLYVGCENAPYRLRFAPKHQPRITSREFHDQLTGLAQEHRLVVQMRCTGYNLFVDTGKPEDFLQTIRKALGLSFRTELSRVVWLDKYGIELEHPELPGIPEVLERVGSQLYAMASK